MQTRSDHSAPKSWWIRYKLYHIPFWFAYHYMWWVVLVGNPWAVVNSIFGTPYAIKYTFYVIFQALGVYFNLYYLIPRFLEKGKYATYIILVLLTIIVCAACIVPGYYVSAWLSGQRFWDLYGVDPEKYFYFFQVNTLTSSAASMTLGMSVKLTKNWLQAKRREQLLEKENLETELKLLKYQFNPHFLFNTINSIFVLIHKNPDMASSSLAKFSDLLRHQLYESNEKQIDLQKEVAYLENFIQLEKLRHNNSTIVTIHMQKQYDSPVEVAPFILMTFIENAFKHVSRNTDTTNWVQINLSVDGQTLHFFVANSTHGVATTDVIHYGGIGLKNVQRRLDLMYPGTHSLDIQKNTDSFEVRLTLQLQPLSKVNPDPYIEFNTLVSA